MLYWMSLAVLPNLQINKNLKKSFYSVDWLSIYPAWEALQLEVWEHIFGMFNKVATAFNRRKRSNIHYIGPFFALCQFCSKTKAA
jgi:hypothetical protein